MTVKIHWFFAVFSLEYGIRTAADPSTSKNAHKESVFAKGPETRYIQSNKRKDPLIIRSFEMSELTDQMSGSFST